MGYRSEVAYTIRFTGDDDNKNKQSFFTFLAEAKSKPETALCFADEESEYMKVDESKLSINYSVSYVKWYDDYEDVKCHDALLKMADDYSDVNDCIGFLFYRIGEELNDIDERWGGNYDYEWLGVNREITKDW